MIRRECGPGTVVIAAEDLPGKGWFPVRVVSLRGRGLAPVAYAVHFQGKTALFSGRIPIQSKVEREQVLMPEISSSRRIGDRLFDRRESTELARAGPMAAGHQRRRSECQPLRRGLEEYH